MAAKSSRSVPRESKRDEPQVEGLPAMVGCPMPPTHSHDDDWNLSVYKRQGESDQQAFARYALMPQVAAAQTIKYINRRTGASLNSIIEALEKQCEAAKSNDLSRAEELLITQAHTLDAVFNDLLTRGVWNRTQNLHAAETYMRLALRAQKQCRETLETLATVKNPPNVAFVKQANIANGPQQVNNGRTVPAEASRERAIENPPNKLLEHTDGERLDFGTTQAAGGGHSELEALGAIDRTEKPGR